MHPKSIKGIRLFPNPQPMSIIFDLYVNTLDVLSASAGKYLMEFSMNWSDSNDLSEEVSKPTNNPPFNVFKFANNFVKSVKKAAFGNESIKKSIKPKQTKKMRRKKTEEPSISKELSERFSKEYENKYLKGYLNKKPIKYETLKEAMEDSSKRSDVGGITMSTKYNKYTLRKGRELLDSKTKEKSWIKL